MKRFLLVFAASFAALCAQIPDLQVPDTGAKPVAAQPAKQAATAQAAPAKAPTAQAQAPKPAAAPAAKVAAAPAQSPQEGMPEATQKADLSLEQVLAKARAYAGKENALKAVKALEYEGRVADQTGAVIAQFKYIYQKPYFFRRQEVRANGGFAMLCKDDFEAWVYSGSANGETRRAPMAFGTQDFERNLAIDRLNFFQGASAIDRAEVSLAGVAQWAGRKAYRLDYVYPVGLGKMTMTRYIDAETGRSLAVVSDGGKTQAVDSGALESGGIKFPKETSIYRDGKLQMSLMYEKIVVNGEYPPQTFTSLSF